MGSPTAPITCNLFVENSEQEAIATNCQLWNSYLDDAI